MLATLLATVLTSVAVASPAPQDMAVPRLNFHLGRAWGLDLQIRQNTTSCPTGYDVCVGTSCYPLDGTAVCCDDGTFCPGGFRCLPTSCCQIGTPCDSEIDMGTSTLIINNGTVPAASQTSTAPTGRPAPPSLSLPPTSGGNGLAAGASASAPADLTPTGATSAADSDLEVSWVLWGAATVLAALAK